MWVLLLILGVLILSLVAKAGIGGSPQQDADLFTEQTPDYSYTQNAMNIENGVDVLFNAIKIAEGSDPTHNNPLDLKIPGWTGPTFGAGICVFATPQEGINRGKHQLQLIGLGLSAVYSLTDTIRDMARKWTVTDQDAWAINVANQIGAQLDPVTGLTGETVPATTLGDIFGVIS